MNTADLINLLCLPQSYPHSVEVITTIETHISVVFLTGSYAYKLKKKVDFGFLNFSTLALRKKYCHLELQLNHRYSPQLYLDVVAVYVNQHNQIAWQPTEHCPEPVEYLVKMKQFDPNDVLGKKLQTESLSSPQVNALATLIAGFHQTAEPISGHLTLEKSHLGTPKTLLHPMLDNFPTLYDNATPQELPPLKQLETWTQQQFKTLAPLMKNRRESGYVRACHGDLHIDNITLIQHQPVLFDGIEFNESFRWIDVISDLAFLLIDLDFRKQTALAYNILSLYLSQTTDYPSLKLLRFYQVYRALVRAKITTLRATQLPSNSLEKRHLMQTAQAYIDLATHYTQPKPQQRLILLQGVSGSGKSYFSEQLLTHMDAIVLSSDRVRKQLYGISPLHRVTEAEKKHLYSAKMNRKVYQTLLEQAKQILLLGFNVIVDATFLQHKHRTPFYELCERLPLKVAHGVIYIDTPKALATLSIEARQHQKNNPSDANVSVMLNQYPQLEPPTESENALILNATQLRHFFPTSLVQDFLNRPIHSKKP
ncbi:MAG: AAA family ATPase [Thiomicrorhabdus sp.]|nr:AAA family ATPase [Thiomicrorhabdus sp.]